MLLTFGTVYSCSQVSLQSVDRDTYYVAWHSHQTSWLPNALISVLGCRFDLACNPQRSPHKH